MDRIADDRRDRSCLSPECGQHSDQHKGDQDVSDFPDSLARHMQDLFYRKAFFLCITAKDHEACQ